MGWKDDEDKRNAEIDALPDCELREPCKQCGTKRGKGPQKVNGQNTVRCAVCRRFQYNAPKSETGEAVRSIRSREDVDSFQRARIFERDGAICGLCARRSPDVILHVAHLISVADCIEYGFGSVDYNDDANLFVACEECNLGQGAKTYAPTMLIRLILKHNQYHRERRRT